MNRGWRKASVGELIDPKRPITYGVVQPGDHDPNGIPLVRGGDFSFGWKPIHEYRRISASIDRTCSRGRLKAGDIVITIKGDVGSAAIVPPFLAGANISQTNARLAINSDKAVADIVLAFLQSREGRKQIAAVTQVGAQPGLIFRDIQSLELPLPPLPEQRKIAEILRTWDEAIEKLEALRAAKKKVRNATLQKVLNNPDWPETPLGELGTVASAGVDKKSVDGEKPVQLLNFLDVLRRDFFYDAEFTHEVTAPERKASTCDVRIGDVFFTPSSETRDDIAHSAVAMETMPGVVYSYHVVRLRPTARLDLRFRAYLFKSSHFLRQAYALAAGSGQRYVLSQDQFRQMTVRLPDYEIQAKVSAYFAAADHEVSLIETKIETLTRQKRGLMQKLLTGEWRVQV